MNFKIERIKREMTQKEFADFLGIKMNTVIKIEKGYIDEITILTLKKISDKLNLSIKYLFFDDN